MGIVTGMGIGGGDNDGDGDGGGDGDADADGDGDDDLCVCIPSLGSSKSVCVASMMVLSFAYASNAACGSHRIHGNVVFRREKLE